MAVAAVTYTFAAGAASAANMNQNFTDLVNFLNASVIHKDGSVAMTAALSLVASDPVSGDHAARKSYVDNKATTTSLAVVPIGEVVLYPLTNPPAAGTATFLECNGGTASRTTYSTLFALVSTTYGAGDGATTFGLPNLTPPNANMCYMIRAL